MDRAAGDGRRAALNIGNDIAIIGGGWAGIAAALKLAAAGRPVHLFESAPQLGGRARSLDWEGLAIDNGPHLMLGAYRAVLKLMADLDSPSGMMRRPLVLRHPELHLALPRLPAPLHLLAGLTAARGLSWAEKAAAARLVSTLRKAHWKIEEDQPLGAWLRAQEQGPRLLERLWEPLALAALNTPVEEASARVFAAMLRDSLGGTRAASDAWFTRRSLAALVAEPARLRLESLGTQVYLRCRVEAIVHEPGGLRLVGPNRVARHVILAAHPAQAGALLPADARLNGLRATLADLRWNGILSLWLRFAAPFRFPYPLLGLGPGNAPWAFARDDIAPGVVALTASAIDHFDADTTRADWLNRLQRQVGPLPALRAHRFIHEKRATFACVPGRQPPPTRTALPGLWLAGDYTHPEYPATLEAAVASGVQCARQILHTA